MMFGALPGLAAQNFLEQLPDTATYVPGQIIVKTADNAALPGARLSALGLAPEGRAVATGEFVYQIPAPTLNAMAIGQQYNATMTALDSLRAEPNVEWAQLNYRVYIVGRAPIVQDVVPNDTRYGDQWHYFNNGAAPGESPGGIGLPGAWQQGTGAVSATVGILDTGILPNHPDIVGSGNILPGFDMISDPFIANDGGGRDNDPTDPGDAIQAGECGPGSPPVDFDDSWHGTHVGGTVGAGNTNNNDGVAGVNWSVGVIPVRVLGKCGGTTADINDGIRWAAGLPVPGVPDNQNPARVISMSLGAAGLPCSLSPSTQSAINDAVGAGSIVVVAAGNEAGDAANAMPASCNGVVTVAASEARGRLATRYSNFGATIEIMAPGGDGQRDDNNDGNPDGVLSMVQGGYAFYNGTSMATPHVSGVLALWISQTPNISNDSLLTELYARALPRTATECPSPCGAGLLQADRSLEIPDQPLLITVTRTPSGNLDVGETAAVTARVSMVNQPQPGRTVTFSTADAGIATVSPTTATTNAQGEATTTLTAVARGTTDVTASSGGAAGSTPVRVPALTVLAAMLVALAMALFVWFRKRPAVRSAP
jgi:serine protease